MRFKEIEDERDALQWIGEVYNPFGYITFALDDDKDWWEKAEHGAVAYGTFALPLHFGAAISTGGYWANLPPGIFSRSLAVRKFASDIYIGAARHGYHAARGAAHGFSRFVPGISAGAFAAGIWMGAQELLQHFNPDMPDFGDMRIRYR